MDNGFNGYLAPPPRPSFALLTVIFNSLPVNPALKPIIHNVFSDAKIVW